VTDFPQNPETNYDADVDACLFRLNGERAGVHRSEQTSTTQWPSNKPMFGMPLLVN
jgi:hypothetical protein